MNRRVRSVAAALLALTLSLSAPVASAAVVDRDGGITVRDRIIRVLKKIVKPLGVAIFEDEAKPTPPHP
ncbi:MAG TPA: hypothetical protein VF057_10435 [Thermoanaerobaculia bacterium]